MAPTPITFAPYGFYLCLEVVSSLKVNLAKLVLVPMGNVDNVDELVISAECNTF